MTTGSLLLVSVNLLYFSGSLRLKWNYQHIFAFCELDCFLWKCMKLIICGRGVQAFAQFIKLQIEYGWKNSL